MKHFHYDFSIAGTADVLYNSDNYFMRTRDPLTPSGTLQPYDSYNHAPSVGPTDVEVEITGGELLMQMHNDYAPWGLGRLQWDVPPADTGNPKHYMERKTVRLPASMAPYQDYFATWYSFNEYRTGFNWVPGVLDTQYQLNIFTRNAWDYLLFSPTINHYNTTLGFFQNRWAGAPSVRVPIDSEFELQQIMRNSLGSDGRWLCMIKLAGGSWQVLFDYQGRTAHPDAVATEDFNFFNPLKIYTNAGVIDYMNANAGIAALACTRIKGYLGY